MCVYVVHVVNVDLPQDCVFVCCTWTEGMLQNIELVCRGNSSMNRIETGSRGTGSIGYTPPRGTSREKIKKNKINVVL